MDLDRIKYWSDLSDYDMETAEAMFSTGRWLYVGYMCHQVIGESLTEERCNGIISKTREVQSWVKTML